MGSAERLTDVLSVTLVPARQGYEEDGLLTFRLTAAKSQTMTNELGWWAARHLALDYFAGLGGSLGLRSLDASSQRTTSPGRAFQRSRAGSQRFCMLHRRGNAHRYGRGRASGRGAIRDVGCFARAHLPVLARGDYGTSYRTPALELPLLALPVC